MLELVLMAISFRRVVVYAAKRDYFVNSLFRSDSKMSCIDFLFACSNADEFASISGGESDAPW